MRPQADHGRRLSGHRQPARWPRPDRIPDRAIGKVGARHVLLLFRQGPVGGTVRELEDLLLDGVQLTGGFISGVLPFHWAQVVNIKRDPFETSIGSQYKTLMGLGGTIGSPSTAYLYDWNMLPIGQALWLKELGILQGVPGAAGPGELQPRPGYGADQELERPVGLTVDANMAGAWLRRPPLPFSSDSSFG